MESISLQNLSPSIESLKQTLTKFVIEKCQPAEIEYEHHLQNRIGKQRWTMDAIPPCIQRLKQEAKELGLWNLFLPHSLPRFLVDEYGVQEPGMYLTNREYGILCEIMGRSFLASEACNCNAPDTGNMEGKEYKCIGIGRVTSEECQVFAVTYLKADIFYCSFICIYHAL
jgi:acyl-CoA dehydrogenase